MNASGSKDLLNRKLDVDPARASVYSATSTPAARQEVLAVLVAALIGLSAGLLVVWLRVAIDGLRVLLHSRWLAGPRIVLAPVLGGLIAAVLLQKFSKLHSGAITDTKASLYLNNGYISPRSTIAEFLSSALAIGAGHPLGPEDPLLRVGAGLGSFLGRTFRLPRERLAHLAPVGAAAGIAGALNAPLAAVLFVIEAVIGSWTSPAQIGLVVLGSLSSVAVVRYFLGSQPLFRMPAIHGSPREIAGYLILGLIGGLAGLLLCQLIRLLRQRIKPLPDWTYSLQVAMVGILVGAAAYFGLPQVMGPGYDILGQLMYGQLGWKLLVLLAAMKLLLAALSFATRTPGGIIAPTLFIGAMLGAATIALQHLFTGHATASAPAFVLLGMGALLAAVLRTPLAAILLVVEFSGSNSMIAPAVVVVGTSWLLAVAVQRHSLFESLMKLDGICLPEVEEQKLIPVLQVQDAMQAADFPVVDGSSKLRDAWREVAEYAGELIFVRHADASWTTIERSLLDRLEATSDPQQRLQDVVTEPAMPRLFPDLPLDTTLRHLHRWPVLPVVSRADVGTLEGVITMEAVMHRYQAGDEPIPPATTTEPARGEPDQEPAQESDPLIPPTITHYDQQATSA